MSRYFYPVALCVLLLVGQAASTHLMTCTCGEITELVNKTVQQATDNLEIKLSEMLNNQALNGMVINTTLRSVFDKTFEIIRETEMSIQDLKSDLINDVEKLLAPIKVQLNYHLQKPLWYSNSEENPAESCKAIYDSDNKAPSGYYWIATPYSSRSVRVYCKMDASCGEPSGGWMRVAYIDMKNSSHQCPSGMNLTERDSPPRRVCDIAGDGCVGTSFSTHGLSYSFVYGRIIAYQNKISLAFLNPYSDTLDGPYVYGVSLTHGHPRHHVWTFAGAVDESEEHPDLKCPCINTKIPLSEFPSYLKTIVGNDYFCDTALSEFYGKFPSILHSDDPLWDGQGCGPNNTCCSKVYAGGCSAPWFMKHLPTATTDDIEMRLCRPDHSGSTPFELVELYVQ